MADQRPGARPWQIVVGILGLVVTAGVAIAMLGGDHGPGQHGPAGDPGHAPVHGAAEVTVTATEMAFAPDMLELVAGEPVNVTLANDGELEHDWELAATGVHLHATAGDRATGALVVHEPGRYEAICTVPGHADAGMRMRVEVAADDEAS